MKDIYKNPITYYIAVPVIIAIWPLLLWAVYLPGVQKNWQIDKDQYTKARKIMENILRVDPVGLIWPHRKTLHNLIMLPPLTR